MPGPTWRLLFLAPLVSGLLVLACTRDPLNGEVDPTGPEGPVAPLPEDGGPPGPPGPLLPAEVTEEEVAAACAQPVSWAFVGQYVGQRIGVVGFIEDARNDDDRVVFEFGDPQGGAEVDFQVMAPSAVVDRFPRSPSDFYVGRLVCVAGVVQEVEGQLMIIISSPTDIILLD